MVEKVKRFPISGKAIFRPRAARLLFAAIKVDSAIDVESRFRSVLLQKDAYQGETMTCRSLLRIVGLSLSLVSVLAHPVHADSILLVDHPGGGSQIHAYSPIGQTFTAEDPGISTVGFVIGDLNSWVDASDLSIEYRLYAGVGVGGSLLATREVFPLPDGPHGRVYPANSYGWWANASFAGIPLTVGNVYSLIVANETARWGIAGYGVPAIPNNAYYAGGTALRYGLPQDYDLAFYICSESSPGCYDPGLPPPFSTVPDPSSLVLFGTGLLVGWRKRRTTNMPSR